MPCTEWSVKDAVNVLQNSPWAHEVSIGGGTPMEGGPSGGGRRGGGGMGGNNDMGGMATGGTDSAAGGAGGRRGGGGAGYPSGAGVGPGRGCKVGCVRRQRRAALSGPVRASQ